MPERSDFLLYKQVMDILPTPVLIKDDHLRYVFINKAFEALFQVDREYIIGELDCDVFKDRQVAQCNGGDLRVLATGEIDEAYESVFDRSLQQREVITRKSRLTLDDGDVYLVGTIYDITDVTVMNQQLMINQAKLKDQSEQLETMANTDPLTGCSNRRALDNHLPALFAAAAFQGGLLAIDIDHFKQINDSYGHHIGDLTLQKMVEVIADTISPTAQLVRMGGEEFLVACAGLTEQQVSSLAEQLRTNIAAASQRFCDQQCIAITVSIGVSHSKALAKWNLERLINMADEALYRAKELGRNRVECAF